MPFDHNDHYHPLLLRQVPRDAVTALDVGCGVRHEVARVEWIRLWRSAYAGIVIPG
jgi:hypothetical protein